MSVIFSRNRIGKRLIRKAALLSLALSVVFSLLQTVIEYNRNLDSLETAVDLLVETETKEITAALWNLDRRQIEAQVEGLRHYPFVSYAAILSQTAIVSETGTRGKPNAETRTVPMSMEYNGRRVPVGSLYLEIDHSTVMGNTLFSAAVNLVFQATTIIIVMLFALKLFEHEVTSHLSSAASHFSSIDIERMKQPLSLNKHHHGDEIDALVDAFNQMRESLTVAYQQLNQVQKMEAVGRLAGGVAHDYNNKLTVILGYAQLLKHSGVDNEEAGEQIEEIIRAAELSRDITRQLLAFSRNQSVTPVRVDLARLIERAQKSLIRLIGEDIALEVIPGAGLWKVRMDPTQADQLIMNLVLNARDAIAGNGRVTVATENVVLDEAACGKIQGAVPGDHVLLTVTDTGRGMDHQTLEHIFEPFFSTKELGKGTGLGLSTVYGIVRQVGGAIAVKSEPGAGTEFSVYLPRFSATEEDVEPAAVPLPPKSWGTVLVVDDDEAIRQITARMLRQSGFTVLVAEGPEEAIGICRQPGTVVDLILTDVIMPTMNAGEMIPLALEHQPSARVLCMSGYAADVIEQRGMIGDGVPFLQKPFSPETLREKIDQVMPAGN